MLKIGITLPHVGISIEGDMAFQEARALLDRWFDVVAQPDTLRELAAKLKQSNDALSDAEQSERRQP